MPKKQSEVPQASIDLYEAVIAAHPDIERKGATVPYTSVNGHMFSCFNKAGELGLRLSKEERGAFLSRHKTTLFESYGVVMKEYVTVPHRLLKKTEEFLPYLDLSYSYVRSLKPKPTARRK